MSYSSHGDFDKLRNQLWNVLRRVYPKAPSLITQTNKSYLNGERSRDQVASLVMRDYYNIGLTHERKFMAALTLDTLHCRTCIT